MSAASLKFRRGPRNDWTAADFDSYTVLAELGVDRPAAKVSHARRGRPLRRAYRAALRAAAVFHLIPAPIRKEVVSR
ncbi:hypothetical protein ACFWUZ_31890 [Streptomyces sp. NPDC058646]|uniref:hypothetical protein n=1 Tax=Streptomyces sp. NPDC058646 TaxID=3346574 RepID=UPI003649CE59